MTEHQLQSFLREVSASPELQEKLRSASDNNAVTAIAREAGYNIDISDLVNYQQSQVTELGDRDLEQVAGGDGDIGAQIFGCLVLLSWKSENCKWEK